MPENFKNAQINSNNYRKILKCMEHEIWMHMSKYTCTRVCVHVCNKGRVLTNRENTRYHMHVCMCMHMCVCVRALVRS